MTAAIVRLASG